MQIYDYAESYNGSDILIKVALRTSAVNTDDGTVNLHTLTAYIDDVVQFEDTAVTTAGLMQQFSDALAAMKAQIDGVEDTEAAALLLSAGFTLDPVVDTPANFFIDDNGSPGELKLVWDVYGPVENYIIQRGLMADHSDATTIMTGDSTPFFDTGLTTGTHYYYQMKGQIAGMADSAWAYADAVAP